MIKYRQLAPRTAVALAVTALVGASAFADSRPSNGTRAARDDRGAIRRGASSERSTASRRDNSSNASSERRQAIDRGRDRDAVRSDSRIEVRGERPSRSGSVARPSRDRSRSVERPSTVVRPSRDANRSNDRRSGDVRRNDGRSSSGRYYGNRGRDDSRNRGTYDRNRSNRDGNWRGDSRSGRHERYGRSHGHSRPYYSHGRVSRVHRHGHGYRVWIHGSSYPFFIPITYWHPDRFRVGLSIRLGGYYNPLGYYDYYDERSGGELRGVVESVDYRRDSFVIRNDATGSFVTVSSRDGRIDVRPGDYVELSGEWTRDGVFRAWDADLLDYQR